MAANPSPERRPRDLMVAGAVVITAGLACVGSSHPDVGGVVLLSGWLLLGASVHRFGRSVRA